MPVKIARLQVGASALEVALTAGLTATRVSYIERGLAQPTPAETEALSAAIAKLAAGGAR
jgi:transcriptional regulator with XRE-family HTH domain